MAKLKKDVKIDEAAFDTALKDLNSLIVSINTLKGDFNKLFRDLSKALQCETGDELEKAGHDVVIEPIENLRLVIVQVRDTLKIVKGEGYYKSIFNEFNALVDGITS
jgi:hypothetical protein